MLGIYKEKKTAVPLSLGSHFIYPGTAFKSRALEWEKVAAGKRVIQMLALRKWIIETRHT